MLESKTSFLLSIKNKIECIFESGCTIIDFQKMSLYNMSDNGFRFDFLQNSSWCVTLSLSKEYKVNLVLFLLRSTMQRRGRRAPLFLMQRGASTIAWFMTRYINNI